MYLGRCLLGMNRLEEAESLLVEGYRVMQRTWGDEHADTQAALESLVALYEAWGKPEKAAEYRALLPPGSPGDTGRE